MNTPHRPPAGHGHVVALAGSAAGAQGYFSAPPSGRGPGLLLACAGLDEPACRLADYYADEGYAVLAPDPGADAARALRAGLRTLREHAQCTGSVTAVGFGAPGAALAALAGGGELAAAALYWPQPLDATLAALAPGACPLVLHFPEHDAVPAATAMARARAARGPDQPWEIYPYPGQAAGFGWPGHAGFDRAAAGMAYSRTLALLRRTVGPHYDLAAIFDEHVMHEFGSRDADATIATMVADPYVNSVPTLTGGVGRDHLHRFYKYHFIPRNPPDTRMVPISRTIGPDRLVDEFIMCFTHNEEIDYMLPGIPPTGRYVELPMVIIASFRGDKVYNEHIYWDQATVLVQIGLLDPAGLPVSGAEQAHKLRDKDYPSNRLMEGVWQRSEAAAAADRKAAHAKH